MSVDDNLEEKSIVASMEDENTEIEAEAEAAIKKLSSDNPTEVTEIMAMMGGQLANPLHKKINSNHINQVLDIASKHDERQYELHKGSQRIKENHDKSSKRYFFAIFVLSLCLITVILFVFKDKPEILVPILTGIGGLTGGFLGGWGYGKST